MGRVLLASNGQPPPGMPAVPGGPPANPVSQVMLVLTVALVILAAVNAIVTVWATVLDASYPAARAVVSAAPDSMLAWLWGRADYGAVTVTGDPAWAAYLRRLLAAVTV
jgi:hypothetical protein